MLGSQLSFPLESSFLVGLDLHSLLGRKLASAIRCRLSGVGLWIGGSAGTSVPSTSLQSPPLVVKCLEFILWLYLLANGRGTRLARLLIKELAECDLVEEVLIVGAGGGICQL
jgi:hypothetical protein